MANIQERISKLFPDATFETGADGRDQIVIPGDQLHKLAETLKNDSETAMDYLVTIVGMDWGESLGCIYYLASSKYNTLVSVKCSTTDRENPALPSVSDLWGIAGIYEREVYDFFGIIFLGNPDMRRLFLNIDWKVSPCAKIMTQARTSIPSQPRASARAILHRHIPKILRPEKWRKRSPRFRA